MHTLNGRVIIVTGGSGHLGSAVCHGIAEAGGKPIAVGRTEASLHGLHMSDRRIDYRISDADNLSEIIPEIFGDYFRIDGLVNIVGDVEICTEAVRDHVSVIANCVSLWSDLAPNPAMYLDLGNCPSPGVVRDKGGRLALSRYYAATLAPAVRVNTFSPGWFPKKRGPERPDYIEEITSRTPLGRIGIPEDIVGTVLFLLSDGSKFMTGQNLVVDGGYSIW